MNATAKPAEVAENIIALATQLKTKQPAKTAPQAFRIIEFTNRGGSNSWRVTGHKRDGSRVRENFTELVSAQARQTELTLEWLGQQTETIARATTLTESQLRLAEAVFQRLETEVEILPAIEHWIKTGKQAHVKETVRIDDAFERFKAWLDQQPEKEMSHATKKNLRNRVNVFANSIGNLSLPHINPDVVSDFLQKRSVSIQTRTNDRLALSRFFSWCKSQKWVATNPARKEEKTRRPARPEPVVLSLDDCQRLLRCAESFKAGRLVPYVATCLFGGLRPSEAMRLTWDRVNMADRELVISNNNKTKRGRTIKLDDTLLAWLKKYEGQPFKPSNIRKDFDAMRLQAGFGTPDENDEDRKNLKPWVEDYMRHTAISHYFRRCGSYGLTAEWAGNSEAIIKAHYQGRVTSEDTKKFYALLPKKGGAK